MQNKRCIFHVPNHIDSNAKSGSQVRPLKLQKAFEAIGYQVDIVMGNNAQRQRIIKKLKQNIKNGIKYQFLYSESSTMPTLLTDANHLPTHPTIDFGMMKFCRKNGIKVGVFYRDIHWQFPDYKREVPWYQKIVTIPMYRYDLKMYNQHVDILYLTSKQTQHYIQSEINTEIKLLPPGAEYNAEIVENRKSYFRQRTEKSLKFFYVGGMGAPNSLYDFVMILKIVKEKPNVEFTICCRKEEWEKNRSYYEPYMTERIHIIHKAGKELEKFYMESDICMCYYPRGQYRDMAVPIKLLEYLAYATPIIATKGGATGEFVQQNDIGWCIDYEENKLSSLIDKILGKQELIYQKHKNAIHCLQENSWQKRAKQVAEELGGKWR
jgi:Glycosyltransferase